MKILMILLLFLLHGVALCAEINAGRLYSQYCSVCHGEKGDSKSRARGSMIPPPRDLTSPESSIELTRERMIQSVSHGRPGTAMAAWKNQLSSEQIAAIVDYIRITMMLPAATTDSESGRRLYAENCSVCHGDDGQGARWTLTNLKPPPRNFTLPQAADELSRNYMLEVVRYGKADTAMPGFSSQLDESDISKVVDYVRQAFMSLTGDSGENTSDSSQLSCLDIEAPMPQGLKGDITRGQAYYIQNCVACHGLAGDGKGPRAYFILPKPRNFHHAASRHSLNRPTLFTAIARGSRGTDMPAWDTVMPSQQIADIAEYIYQTFIRQDQTANQSSKPDKG
ncbi:MAG: c-type cytochrome [Candidatus Thiodiazotropha sp. (ex. Lucinoma kazani)]